MPRGAGTLPGGRLHCPSAAGTVARGVRCYRPRTVGVPGVATAAAWLVLALGVAAPAGASQTINVATTTDAVDPTPADGTCDSPCSLRGAIQTANGVGSPGADGISIPAN